MPGAMAIARLPPRFKTRNAVGREDCKTVMFITVKKIRTLGAVIVSAGLTTALVAWPRLNWSQLQPPSLLTAGPGGALLLTTLLIVAVAAAAFLLPLIIPRRRLTSVVFFMTLGLVALSICSTGRQSVARARSP